MTRPNIIKTNANGQYGLDLRFGSDELAKDTRDLTAQFLNEFFTILERDLLSQLEIGFAAFKRSREH